MRPGPHDRWNRRARRRRARGAVASLDLPAWPVDLLSGQEYNLLSALRFCADDAPAPNRDQQPHVGPVVRSAANTTRRAVEVGQLGRLSLRERACFRGAKDDKPPNRPTTPGSSEVVLKVVLKRALFVLEPTPGGF